MSIDLFRVVQGIGIESEDLSSNANVLQGIGSPGGDVGIQDASPVGTIFLRTNAETNNLQLYWKYTTVNNSSADWKQASDKDYVDAVAAGMSWRAPVRVRDNTLYANAAAFPAGGTINGVILNVKDRVLFSNVALSTDKNVFIWNGVSFTEDVNAETDGDAVLVQDGSDAETQWVYDGTNWVQFGSSTSTAELSFIRSFVGKTGPGAESPTYSSVDVITQASNLETAIGDLDNAMGTGEITNDGGNFALTDDMSWGASGTLEVTDALNQLNNAVGDRSYTLNNVVTDNEAIASSIEKLDLAVGLLQDQGDAFYGTNVTAIGTVTVDTIPTALASEVKWMVQVRETGTPANRRAEEVHAITDGTLQDFNRSSTLTLGSSIAGFQITVDLSGATMRLRLKATNNIDYVVKRIAYSAFS